MHLGVIIAIGTSIIAIIITIKLKTKVVSFITAITISTGTLKYGTS